jgi:hypothetical protein
LIIAWLINLKPSFHDQGCDDQEFQRNSIKKYQLYPKSKNIFIDRLVSKKICLRNLKRRMGLSDKSECNHGRDSDDDDNVPLSHKIIAAAAAYEV